MGNVLAVSEWTLGGVLSPTLQVRVLSSVPYTPEAQVVEQRTLNPKVAGSIPVRSTFDGV